MNLRKEILKEQYEAEFFDKLIPNIAYIGEGGTIGGLMISKFRKPPPRDEKLDRYSQECCSIILSAWNAGLIYEHFKAVADNDLIGYIDNTPCMSKWDDPELVIMMPKTDEAKISLWTSEMIREIKEPGYKSHWWEYLKKEERLSQEEKAFFNELAKKLKFT